MLIFKAFNWGTPAAASDFELAALAVCKALHQAIMVAQSIYKLLSFLNFICVREAYCTVGDDVQLPVVPGGWKGAD